MNMTKISKLTIDQICEMGDDYFVVSKKDIDELVEIARRRELDGFMRRLEVELFYVCPSKLNATFSAMDIARICNEIVDELKRLIKPDLQMVIPTKFEPFKNTDFNVLQSKKENTNE